MRILPLLAAIAIASSCEAAISGITGGAKTTDSDIVFLPRALTAEHQTKPYLRQHDEANLATPDSDNEERVSVADMVASFEHLGFAARGFHPSALGSASAFTARMETVSQMYPRGLSKSALRQLTLAEHMREMDIAQGIRGTKDTPNGMVRYIPHTDDLKTAPVMVSHTGRDNQLYDPEDGSRLLSCIVASNGKRDGDVLLISSSNPAKKDWLLPKGGWNAGETINNAAKRELMEEGGVEGRIRATLEPFKIEGGHTYYPFKMRATTVFDQWPESIRYRIWVSYDDAELLLEGRPEMLAVLRAARTAN